MIDCAQAEERIERRLDSEATPVDDAQLDAHVAGCRECASLLALEANIDAALAARLRGAEPALDLGARVRRRVEAESARERGGFIADALNAAGFVITVALAVPVLAGLGAGATGLLLTLGAVAIGVYPVLVATFDLSSRS
jgi:predicted anti-sigma-YlaC factor YlaD